MVSYKLIEKPYKHIDRKKTQCSMFCFNVPLQIFLICGLIVTLITSKFDTFMLCLNVFS